VAGTAVGRRFAPVIVGVLLVAFVAGCGTGSTTTPAPTVAPTVAVTPAPSVAGSPAASKSDPAVGLAIASPYTLGTLPAALEAGMETAMTAAMGSMASIVQIGARTADKAGVTQSYVLVLRLPGVPITAPNFLDSIAGGAAGTTGTIDKTTVSGVDVRVVTTAAGQPQTIFIVGDRIILVTVGTKDIELDVAKALIAANP